MSLPKSDFADSFSEHVAPRLERMIGVLGHLVGVGLCTFSDAYQDVIRYAGHHGAYSLPPDHFQALTDWIGAELIEAAAETEAACGR